MKNIRTVEAYILDWFRTHEKHLSADEAEKIRSHFRITDADTKKIRGYIEDFKQEARLSAILKWWNSDGSSLEYNEIKAIMIIAYLSWCYCFYLPVCALLTVSLVMVTKSI